MTAALLQWLILAVSLINIVLLLWLALTVLLNARRRDWAIWLTSAALFAGAISFLFHALMISGSVAQLNPHTLGRWPLIWAAGLLLPCAWYLVMLWHAGYWEDRRLLPRQYLHRAFLYVTLIGFCTICLLYLLVPVSLTRPLPPNVLFASPLVAGMPILAILYPLFITVCIGLSLDVLAHPSRSPRLMGDLARRRARPWLVATSVMLLLVSLFVDGVLLVYFLPVQFAFRGITASVPLLTALADLGICLLISAAVLLLGQAIVSYEIFTGKSLPRQGLRRNWYRVVVLAVGLGAILSANLLLDAPPVFGALLAAVIVTGLFALYNWRSYRERERYVTHLRPFVSGPPIYHALLTQSPLTVDADAQFAALCEEVLGAEQVYLQTLGSFSALVDPLAYPPDTPAPPPLPELLDRCRTPETLCLPVDAAHKSAASWGVPLWSGNGLIGMLWLGNKRDGGLYTQEDIEIARATGERLIDILAGIRLAQRLMQVQRERLAESQVTDRRTRRVVHDDILPQLHTVIMALSSRAEQAEAVTQLADIHRQLSDILREMPSATTDTLKRLGVAKALHQVAHDEYRSAFDALTWEIDPDAEALAGQLPPVAAEVLFCAAREAVRNAARYGRGGEAARALHLSVTLRRHAGLQVIIADNGIGACAETPTAGGCGQGTLLHSTMMAVIGGAWETNSAPGQYTRVTLTLPEERCR